MMINGRGCGRDAGKGGEVAELLQLKHGRKNIMWMNLPAVKVAVVGMGYNLVAADTGINY